MTRVVILEDDLDMPKSCLVSKTSPNALSYRSIPTIYSEAPLPADHWLHRQPNVLMQPHLGGFTDEGYDSLLTPAVENVIAFLDGALGLIRRFL